MLFTIYAADVDGSVFFVRLYTREGIELTGPTVVVILWSTGATVLFLIGNMADDVDGADDADDADGADDADDADDADGAVGSGSLQTCF